METVAESTSSLAAARAQLLAGLREQALYVALSTIDEVYPERPDR